MLFSYAFVSCRFNIPQKLSKSTLSVPFTQRTKISTMPLSLDISWTLKPNPGSSSSLSLSEAASSVEPCPTWCFLRRAARLQTLPFVNPRPVANIGRYRNLTPKGIKVSLIDRAQESTLLSYTVNVLSEGKGSKCFGSVDVPLATSFEDLNQLIKIKLVFCNLTNLTRPHTPPAPSNAPSPCFIALDKVLDRPIVDSCCD